jgi:Transposase DDE domain
MHYILWWLFPNILIIRNVRKKGYLKIHVAVDIKKKRIISFDVTNEEVHDDGSSLKKLINNALKNNTLKRVIADAAYSNKENFRYLYDNNIEAVIKVSKSSNSAELQFRRLLLSKKNSSAKTAEEFWKMEAQR